MSEGVMMTTGTMTSYANTRRIGGIAGLAVRAGRALENWGRRAAEPLTRDQLERRIAVEREARAVLAERTSAHVGAYQLLR